MKSVGEVMAIGRTFQESFQKALRGLEIGQPGLYPVVLPESSDSAEPACFEQTLSVPDPDRNASPIRQIRPGSGTESVWLHC